jgi:hypothetical protein
MSCGKPEEDYINRQKNRVNYSGKMNDKIGCCHEWLGAKQINGYGHVNPPNADGVKGKSIYVHRWFYTLSKGEIPKGKLIRHKCDNRICVNPDHLEIGDSKDNVRDMIARNPKACGRKLSFQQHEEIKKKHTAGTMIITLAAEYKVSRVTIRKVIQEKHIVIKNEIISTPI